MDKEVLTRQLPERCRQSLDEALRAVDEAPDGQWIAASEWEVRDIFPKLTTDCFGPLLQHRMDRLPSASQAAFSPCGGSDGVAAEGKSPGAGADRRRRS
jgi:hypothetical protein